MTLRFDNLSLKNFGPYREIDRSESDDRAGIAGRGDSRRKHFG